MKGKRSLWLSAAATAAALLFSGCTDSARETSSTGGRTPSGSTSSPSRPTRAAAAGSVGQPAFDFSLEDSDGNTVQLSDYEGKVVVVDFWATWCPPCRKGIPEFVALQEKYRDKGVEVVGVTLDEGWGPVRPFIKSYNINYTVVMGDSGVVQQFGGFRGIPTTFVIDREGIIRHKQEGYAPAQVFTSAVEKLL